MVEPNGNNPFHELEKHSFHTNIIDAESIMHSIEENRYARIEKWTEEFWPAPIGREYKDESFGWHVLETEVIMEN